VGKILLGKGQKTTDEALPTGGVTDLSKKQMQYHHLSQIKNTMTIETPKTNKIIFYIVTTICVLIWLWTMRFNWDTFRWWFPGTLSTSIDHIIGIILYFMPATTLIMSFFIRKQAFFITFAIINGLLIPIVGFLSILPYT